MPDFFDVFSPASIDPATTQATENLRAIIESTRGRADQALDPLALRASSSLGSAFERPPASGRVIVEHAPGPHGEIPVRVAGPTEGKPRGLYVWVHGGGWVIGEPGREDGALELIADELQVITASIDYRLAPEHPFPVGTDEVHAALVWLLHTKATEWGTPVAVAGGISAGAHLLASAVIRLRDSGIGFAGLTGIGLFDGAYDLRGTPSAKVNATLDPILSTTLMSWFTQQFLQGQDASDPEISPLLADLEGLPPALFQVGTTDPLLDDTLLMARRWSAAGNTTEVGIYPGGIHGFQWIVGSTAIKTAARAEMHDFFDRQLR